VFSDAAVNLDNAMVTFDSVIVWWITSAIVNNGDIVPNFGETTMRAAGSSGITLAGLVVVSGLGALSSISACGKVTVAAQQMKVIECTVTRSGRAADERRRDQHGSHPAGRRPGPGQRIGVAVSRQPDTPLSVYLRFNVTSPATVAPTARLGSFSVCPSCDFTQAGCQPLPSSGPPPTATTTGPFIVRWEVPAGPQPVLNMSFSVSPM